MRGSFLVADAAHLPFADDSFDFVFGSPPYLDARTYGIGAGRKCQEWMHQNQRPTTKTSEG